MDKAEFHSVFFCHFSNGRKRDLNDETTTSRRKKKAGVGTRKFLGSKTELYGSNKVFWVLLRVHFSTALFFPASRFS